MTDALLSAVQAHLALSWLKMGRRCRGVIVLNTPDTSAEARQNQQLVVRQVKTDHPGHPPSVKSLRGLPE